MFRTILLNLAFFERINFIAIVLEDSVEYYRICIKSFRNYN